VAEADPHELQLAAWRGLDGFGGRSSLRTWLYRIATNRCLNTLRDSSRRPQTEPIRTVEPTWLEPYPDVLLDDLPDVAPGPEARYDGPPRSASSSAITPRPSSRATSIGSSPSSARTR
jgi:DNA-directed RNA polymerase specialized sigma24 family protein